MDDPFFQVESVYRPCRHAEISFCHVVVILMATVVMYSMCSICFVYRSGEVNLCAYIHVVVNPMQTPMDGSCYASQPNIAWGASYRNDRQFPNQMHPIGYVRALNCKRHPRQVRISPSAEQTRLKAARRLSASRL